MHEYVMVEIDKIKPSDNNARVHSSKQVKQIMESIKEFGFTNPLIIDTEYNLIAGHGRLEALKQLNKIDFKDNPILNVPCIQVKDLSDTQKRALCLADNQIALNSTWDNEKLQDELEKLANENFNFDCLGFDDSVLNDLNIDNDLSDDENIKSREINLDNMEDLVEITFKLSLTDFRDLNATLLSIDSDRNKSIMEILRHFKRL